MYRDSETKAGGSQDHHQLSKQDIQGKKSLLKRISAGELHVSPSDKGKVLVVMSLDMYHQMSVVHTEGDEEVGWRELEESQREVRAHARALSRIVNLGAGGGNRNRARCFDNISSHACDPPVLRWVAKTHKPTGDNGVPKSRPIVGATKGLTTALGEMISDIIEPIARMNPDQCEAQSTEELMREIEDSNVKMKSRKMEETVVASMDVSALYPSLDQAGSARIVKEEFITSGLEVKGVDWKKVALYLAVTAKREELIKEGIQHLVAQRRKV